MISINNLTIQFGAKHLFKNVSASIYPQDRIGLVGVNGAGKSTLLKIVAGIAESDPGTVVWARGVTMGYLPQEVSDIDSERSLFDEAMGAFSHLIAMQRELEDLSHQLGVTDPASSQFAILMTRHGNLQHQLDEANIYSLRSAVEKVLAGLGFKESVFNRPCHTFSGGWLMRLMLAKLLLTRPSCLLLDEPTNHLDLESLTWLEEFLGNYDGALIVISHDRAFLDNLTSATWELSLGNLNIYKGNYTYFVSEKEMRQSIVRASYENQQAYIQQTMRFVDRFRSKSTKAKQVQSRLKAIEKMELIEIEGSDKAISFRFPPAAPSGRLVLHVKHLTKSYAANHVLTDVTFDLQRGDKVAVIGVNGAGKSTFVRIAAGLLRPDSGEIRLGYNVCASYFGQHQAQELRQELTVEQTFGTIEGERTITQIRSLLGAFLFSGDDVNKPVSVLSGGEKSRLALAKMIASPANLLIMDEPTNHLDMASQEILQEALSQYDGTVVVVSHNRSFLDHFITKVLEIKDGRANIYEGTVKEYLDRRKAEQQQAPPAKGKAQTGPGRPLDGGRTAGARDGAGETRKEERQRQAQLRQQRNQEAAPYRKKAQEAEAEIERLEKRKSQLEGLLADPELYKRPEDFAEKNRDYQDIGSRLDRLFHKWEEANVKIEAIEAKYPDIQ